MGFKPRFLIGLCFNIIVEYEALPVLRSLDIVALPEIIKKYRRSSTVLRRRKLAGWCTKAHVHAHLHAHVHAHMCVHVLAHVVHTTHRDTCVRSRFVHPIV